MRRLYTAIITRKRHGQVNVHNSADMTMPTLGWATSTWDGEQFAAGELSGDPLKTLPLGALRAEFMGRNFGVPSEFLAYERPPQWTFDHALAFFLVGQPDRARLPDHELVGTGELEPVVQPGLLTQQHGADLPMLRQVLACVQI